MTVIRDQGVKNTQLLEVMAKHQNEAQTAAAAAMVAQNEALKSFHDTIASIVVPLSQRVLREERKAFFQYRPGLDYRRGGAKE